MRFGGFIKNSLIDYPGKISSVIFFKGCNYRCPYCHNKTLVCGPGPMASPIGNMIDESFVLTYLEKRKKLIDGVVLSGGEPTLTRSLLRICKDIKNMGFLVKLDTNGSSPGILENLLYYGLIDYIAMDYKTSFNRYERYIANNADVEAVKRSIQIILDSKVSYEFRTTCAHPIVDQSAIHKMLPYIEGAHRFVLQRFIWSENILNPDFFKDQESTHEDELNVYRELIQPWVKKCVIRN